MFRSIVIVLFGIQLILTCIVFYIFWMSQNASVRSEHKCQLDPNMFRAPISNELSIKTFALQYVFELQVVDLIRSEKSLIVSVKEKPVGLPDIKIENQSQWDIAHATLSEPIDLLKKKLAQEEILAKYTYNLFDKEWTLNSISIKK